MSALSGCEALTHRRQTWLKIETTGSLLLTGEALFPGSRGEDCGLGALVWEGAVGPELEQRGAGLQDVLPGEPGTGLAGVVCLPPPWPRLYTTQKLAWGSGGGRPCAARQRVL